jgi:hypothetical protein
MGETCGDEHSGQESEAENSDCGHGCTVFFDGFGYFDVGFAVLLGNYCGHLFIFVSVFLSSE